VDGKKFQLREPRLTTNKLQVVLRAKVDKSDKEIKLWFDGEKITPRFLQNWPIPQFQGVRLWTRDFVLDEQKRRKDVPA